MLGSRTYSVRIKYFLATYLSFKNLIVCMNQKRVWDAIASQWNNFRQAQFKPVYDFIERYQPKKGKVLEVGCGNARNLIPFAKQGFECHGIDFSSKMIEKSKELS